MCSPGGFHSILSPRDNPEVSVRSRGAIDDAGTAERNLIETGLN